MRTWRVGTVSLGILLVLLGVFLLLSQLFNWDGAYILVSWWPVLLIVLGIEMLIYLFLANKKSATIKYDFLSIILVTSLGFLSISLTALSTTGVLEKLEDWVNVDVRTGNLPEYSLALEEDIDRIVVQVHSHALQIETGKSDEVALFGTYRAETSAHKEPFQSPADYVTSVQQGDTLYITLTAESFPMNSFRSVPPMIATTMIVPEQVALEVHANHQPVTIKPRSLSNHWLISEATSVDAHVHTDANVTVYADHVSEITGEEEQWEMTEVSSAPERLEEENHYEMESDVKLGKLAIGSGTSRIQILKSDYLSVSLIHID